uniref:Uncharacterized protein n=1 Tax=Caenorhabditis japonica TaxID=281687 RepID=A0A8R1DV74_CAEJA
MPRGKNLDFHRNIGAEMAENEEEYFIIRYSGPKTSRDAVYNYVTGKTSNYKEYSELVNDMEVKRAQNVKDFFSALSSMKYENVVPPESHSISVLPNTPISVREALMNGKRHKMNSSNWGKIMKKAVPRKRPEGEKYTELSPNEESSKPTTSSTNGPLSESQSEPKRRRIIRIIRKVRTPRQKLPLWVLDHAAGKMKPPSPNSNISANYGECVPKEEEPDPVVDSKEEIRTCPPPWTDRRCHQVFDSQALKLHNISFEKNKS